MKNKQLYHFFELLIAISVLTTSCTSVKSIKQASNQPPATQTITINSDPIGAKVIFNGKVICNSTPCTTSVPVTYNTCQNKFISTTERMTKTAEANQLKFIFIKEGCVQGEEIYRPILQGGFNPQCFEWPDGIFHHFQKETYREDPTIMAGEATTQVSRDRPGQTALERTVLRWYFDSDPRGARIYWRVISSIPHIVKNTNETYLMTTPFEETRSFNILGLTYENSRDIQIEIKVSKKGYEDQVKRFNVRQSIDQQEISGFFELVQKEE